jgi:hypothetical protein
MTAVGKGQHFEQGRQYDFFDIACEEPRARFVHRTYARAVEKITISRPSPPTPPPAQPWFRASIHGAAAPLPLEFVHTVSDHVR